MDLGGSWACPHCRHFLPEIGSRAGITRLADSGRFTVLLIFQIPLIISAPIFPVTYSLKCFYEPPLTITVMLEVILSFLQMRG